MNGPTVALVGIISIALGLITSILVFGIKLGALQLKVETMWEFLTRRAYAEFINKGLGAMSSPIEITPKGLIMIMPFIEKFLPFWSSLLAKNPSITDGELFLEIERQFGDFLVEQICIPHQLSAGACVIAVIMGCRKKAEERY